MAASCRAGAAAQSQRVPNKSLVVTTSVALFVDEGMTITSAVTVVLGLSTPCLAPDVSALLCCCAGKKEDSNCGGGAEQGKDNGHPGAGASSGALTLPFKQRRLTLCAGAMSKSLLCLLIACAESARPLFYLLSISTTAFGI